MAAPGQPTPGRDASFIGSPKPGSDCMVMPRVRYPRGMRFAESGVAWASKSQVPRGLCFAELAVHVAWAFYIQVLNHLTQMSCALQGQVSTWSALDAQR